MCPHCRWDAEPQGKRLPVSRKPRRIQNHFSPSWSCGRGRARQLRAGQAPYMSAAAPGPRAEPPRTRVGEGPWQCLPVTSAS